MLMLLTNLFCAVTFKNSPNSFSCEWISSLLEMSIDQTSIRNLPEDQMKSIFSILSNVKKFFNPKFLGEDAQLHTFFISLINKIKESKQIHLENYQYLRNQSYLFEEKFLENYYEYNKEISVDMKELKNLILNILEKKFNFDKQIIEKINVTQDKIEDCECLTFQFENNLHENFSVCINSQEPFAANFNIIDGKSYITLGPQTMYDSQLLIHELTHYFLLFESKATIPFVYAEIVTVLMQNSPLRMNHSLQSLKDRQNSFSQETLYNMLISYYLKYGLTDNESQKEAVLSFFSGYTKDHLTKNLNENILSELIKSFGMSFLDFDSMQYFLGGAISHYYYTHHNPSNISIQDFSPLFKELSFEKILQFLKVDLNSFVDWVFAEYFTLKCSTYSNHESLEKIFFQKDFLNSNLLQSSLLQSNLPKLIPNDHKLLSPSTKQILKDLSLSFPITEKALKDLFLSSPKD